MTSPSPSDDTVYVSFTAEFNSQTSEALLGFLGQLVNKGTKKVCLLLSKRWTPSFGQVSSQLRWNPGFMIQAA